MNDILIVDDEKDIRELISEILIDEGYSTRLAGNSAECLNQVSEKSTQFIDFRYLAQRQQNGWY